MNALITTTLLVMAMGTPPAAPEIQYRPKQITRLVRSDAAPRHGAQFAASKCSETHLWKPSPNRHVFFILRDGISLGEYREEILSDGRFLEITEHYLQADARSSSCIETADELPFVRKRTIMDWEDDFAVAETIEWTFLTCTPDGKILNSGPSLTQKRERCLIRLTVPANLLKDNRDYLVGVRRSDLNQFERAFKDQTTSNSTLLKDGEGKIYFAWPEESRSALTLTLSERGGSPHKPLDATPSPEWQAVATMNWIPDASVGKEIDLQFHADQLNR